ncbi:MAG TPA: phosphatidate cytidylyltransferase [Gemmatimonadales bacterium]|nr:phosphatidate cytidylyltransferase [Gemmatimonadales bacterium]
MTRLLSGIVLLALFGSAAWWAPPAWLLVIAVAVAALATIEYCGLARALAAPVPVVPAVVGSGALCVAAAWPGVAAAPVMMAVVIVAGLLLVAGGDPSPATLSRAAAAAFGPAYVGLPLGALIGVRWEHGREAMLLPFLVVIISDTAQYYAGRTMGRRPLAPRLSPKKTLEGAVGGLVAGSAALVVLGHWWWPEAPVALRAVLGATLVVLGIAGDLFESMLKRAAGVKDSSSLIPGHGGVLDRIDALLFVVPVYAVVLRVYPHVS